MLEGGYAFITAFLKGEEARTLNSGHIAGLSRVTRIPDVISAIRDTDIGEYLESSLPTSFDDIDNALWTYLGGCYQRLEWFSDLPSDILRIARAQLVKYDVMNIKAALLAISTPRPARLLPIGNISNQGLLEELASAPEVEDIATVLGKCELMEYVTIVREYEVDGGVKARLQTEARLEAEYYRHLMATAESVKDSPVFIRTLGATLDLKNLQIIIRAIVGGMTAEATEHTISGGYLISRNLIGELMALRLNELPARFEGTQYQPVIEEIISDYEKSRNVSVVDEIIEKHKFRLNREVLSPTVMSPLVAVWYLFIKEVEVRNLRLILKSVLDGVPLEEIRDYLVTAS